MQTCQVCGKQNPTGVEYCEDCGASLTPPSAQASASAPATAGPAAPPSGAPSGTETTGAAPVPPTAGETSGAGGTGTSPALTSPVPAPAAAPAVATGTSPAPAPVAALDPAAGTGTTPVPAGAASAPSAPGTSVGGRARLVVKRFGAVTGEEVPLLAERLVVGRFDPETGPVDIDLSSAPEAEHISRHHGELYREGEGQWLVRDLGSTNGVFVKGGSDPSFGPRITAPRSLADGDELAFGNARFVFKND